VAGCAAPTHWLYEKPGASGSAYRDDLNACQMVARSTRLFDLFALTRLDGDAFKRCMERRGYQITIVR
jgi:hypothetical protein